MTVSHFRSSAAAKRSAGKRLRRCAWPAATELKIPADWPSGVYVGKLTEKGGGRQSYVVFIVRDDRPADCLFQCSDLTWQVYNRWPDQFSLYDDGKDTWYWGAGVQVGFDRPYGKYCQLLDQPLSVGSGEWFLWEFPLAYWMESQGCDVSYIHNLDTHRDPAGLLRARGFLSVGHDEYWTIEMFRNVRAALAAGVNLAFLSGNSAYGRVLLDERQRAFERVGVFGPPHGAREFARIETLPHERPYGNELMGAHTTGAVTGVGDWVCSKPDHWIHAGGCSPLDTSGARRRSLARPWLQDAARTGSALVSTGAEPGKGSSGTSLPTKSAVAKASPVEGVRKNASRNHTYSKRTLR